MDQNKKLKVVWWSNFPLAKTGLARNSKSVLNYLYRTNKFDLVMYCMGQVDGIPEFQKLPYKTLGSIPPDQNIINHLNANPHPSIGYGGYLLDQMVKNERPDVLILSDDFWAGDHTGFFSKPYFNKFHCVVHATIDSEPVLPSALQHRDKIKHYFVWADFAEPLMNTDGFSQIKTITGAIDPTPFYKLSLVEKLNLREKFNIPADSFIVMMTSRNQVRKEFSVLMEGFSKFRKENSDCKNSYLLLHTHVPEQQGWDIPRLLKEHNIEQNTLFTYICKSCQNINVQIYQGQDIDCPHCRTEKSLITCNIGFGCTEEELNNVYNLADCYAHPANAAGLELGLIEALYCELPIATCAYSGTTMFTKNDFCHKIEFSWGRQVGTNFKRAVPYAQSITKFLTKIYKLPLNKRQELGRAGRKYGLQTFAPEVVGKQWEDFLDTLEPTAYDFEFTQPRKNEDYSFDENSISDDGEWITDLYKNILLCSPDEGGLKNWLNGLKQGQTRKQVYDFFIDTAKKQNSEAGQTKEVQLHELFKSDRPIILYIIKESLGDCFIASATFEDLKNRYPNHELWVSSDPQYLNIFQGNQFVDKILPYNQIFENELVMLANGVSVFLHPAIQSQRQLNYLSNNKVGLQLT